MIYVGIDDTDTLDSPGTNQLARAIVAHVAPTHECVRIVRHQLFFDPRVPFTSKNGSASIALAPRNEQRPNHLVAQIRDVMLAWYQMGSDPGLCVADQVANDVTAFGRRCQREIVRQAEARRLAAECGLHLEGLGGTEDGVIGALAAVGLGVTGDDGRVVVHGTWPDDLAGPQALETLHARGVVVRELENGRLVTSGVVDVDKKLRPNLRGGEVVLFVTPNTEGPAAWQAVRQT